MKSRKAAEMTIGTIIVIILALVVLVFLIWGFTAGWGNLRDQILNIFGGGSNIDTLVSSCQTVCATQQAFNYCGLKRDVRFGDNIKAKMTCKQLEGAEIGLDVCDIDCSNYPELSCEGSKETETEAAKGLGGTWVEKGANCPDGKIKIVTDEVTAKADAKKLKAGSICCAA